MLQQFRWNEIHSEINILSICIESRFEIKMPKQRKETHSEFLLRITQIYPKVCRVDQSVLFCLYCECSVQGKTLTLVKQHISTAKHQEKKEKKNNPIESASQSLISSFGGQRAQFYLNLMQICARHFWNRIFLFIKWLIQG